MTKFNLCELRSQAFQVRSSTSSLADSEVIDIETLLDNRTGQYVVRWKDIQRVFGHAKYIKQNGVVISFMTDDNLEDLLPLRISCRPGVILEVVLKNPVPLNCPFPDTRARTPLSFPEQSTFTSVPNNVQILDISESIDAHMENQNKSNEALESAGDLHDLKESPIEQYEQTLSTTIHSGRCSEETYAPNASLATSIKQVAVDLVTSSMETMVLDGNLPVLFDNITTNDKSLALLSSDMSAKAQSSLRAYNQLYGSYFQAILSGQVNQATSIKEAMNEHFGSLQAEMDKNKAMQKQMLRMQQQSLEKQQQALDRLAIIQNRVQTIITQTYELHEYPIPRLFIVLPKSTRRRDRLGKVFSKQFRLFFLCECGAHTMAEGSKIKHKIHLAKHEGYDLDRPTEFFEKYGPYVLAMMEMVKYGFAATSIIVPPLAQLGFVKGIDSVQQGLDTLKDSMGSMVDETIAFIQDQQNNASGGIGIAGEQMRLDKLQVLEGADLRQLESYLKVNDEGRILGNLYRTVTPEGNVKWVCIDHYRENYRASATEQLRDIVVGNGGKFMENIGKVSVNVASSTQARQLYEAITKARGIQELEIALQWDVTLDDLRTFEAAISKANIVTLTMDGAYFKGPAFDIINRGRRYDPILQLMSNGRIQCLRLNQFDQFCLHVNTSSIALAPQLRILVIDLAISLYEKNAQAAFTKILESCPSLTGLRVNSYHQYLVYEIAVGKIEHFRDLRRLTITCGGHTWKANLTQGEIHNAAMTINRLEDVSTDEVRLFQLGQLRTLSIRRTPTEAEASRLTDILRQNPGLLELHIGCHVERSLSLINLVTATRQSMISEDRPCELRRLDLRKDSGDSEADLGKNDVVNSTVEFVDASTSTAPRISTSVSMSRTTRKDEFGGFEDFLREFAWTIEKLETDSTFDDRLATLLDRSTEELGSRLKSLVLLPRNLSSEGLDSVDSVIERSQNLEILQILHHGMKSEEQQQKAERLIRRHGHRLDTLLLSGFAADVWMTRLSAAFPTRRDLPVLTSFRVFCFGKQKLPHHCAQWIAAMASGPSQGVLSVPSPLDPSPQDAFISISQQVAEEVSEAWTPLKELILVCLTIQSEDWKTILEGLDFSALEVLHVTNSNFSLSELKVLVRRISESPEIEVPLRSLRLEKTSISKCDDVDVVRELVEALKKKAPLVKVEGLPLLN